PGAPERPEAPAVPAVRAISAALVCAPAGAAPEFALPQEAPPAPRRVRAKGPGRRSALAGALAAGGVVLVLGGLGALGGVLFWASQKAPPPRVARVKAPGGTAGAGATRGAAGGGAAEPQGLPPAPAPAGEP